MTHDILGNIASPASKAPEVIKGALGYFGLQDWWLSTFSQQERLHIQARFQPLGSPANSLTQGDIRYSSGTAAGLLSALAGWFTKENDRALAYRLLQKAEELCIAATDILDAHFVYNAKISLYYRDRSDPLSLATALDACRQQIAIAEEAARAFRAESGHSQLPSHRGYEQLSIVLERRGEFRETIALCNQAEQQGWAGDWPKRVDRCRKRAERRGGDSDGEAF